MRASREGLGVWQATYGSVVLIQVAASWEFGWDALVAIGTIGLAVFTAGLAFSTRLLASASRAEQRAQWRPMIIVGEDTSADYVPDEGIFLVSIRNVGRGPALGVHAQLRAGRNPAGAAQPRDAIVLAPGESADLEVRVSEAYRDRTQGGLVWYLEVSYYDIGDRWHRTRLVISPANDEDGLLSTRVRRVDLQDTGRDRTSFQGSLQPPPITPDRLKPWTRIRRSARK